MSSEEGEKGRVVTIKTNELSRWKGETLSQQKRRITGLIRLVEEQIVESTGWVERSAAAQAIWEKSVKELETELTSPSPRIKIEEILRAHRQQAAHFLAMKEKHQKKLEELHPTLERYRQFRKGLDAQSRAARRDKK